MLRTIETANIKVVSSKTYSTWRTTRYSAPTDVEHQLREHCRPYKFGCALSAFAEYGFQPPQSCTIMKNNKCYNGASVAAETILRLLLENGERQAKNVNRPL
jgi:hypothetical protein